MPRSILIVDDDHEIWKAYQSVLNYEQSPRNSAAGRMTELVSRQAAAPADPVFSLHFADRGEDGYAMALDRLTAGSSEQPFAVAFIDIRMPPGWDGMHTAMQLRRIDPDLEIVIVTAYTDRSRGEIVKSVGCPEKLLFLRKPFDPEELYQLALSLSEKWLLSKREQRAKQDLAESEARFRSLVEATSDWVWEMDARGKFLYCSPVCEELYGYTPVELQGQYFYEKLLQKEDVLRHKALYARSVAEGLPFRVQTRCCLRKDGKEIFVESSGVPVFNDKHKVVGFRGMDRDISDRLRIQEEKRRLEEQYQQAQKMEAIGTLAGGIAHDLNNVLTPIIGYAELCRLMIGTGSTIDGELEMIEKSAYKAARLIRQILTFSRKQILSPSLCDLNDHLNDFFKMLRRLIPENISLVLETAPQIWPIYIDTGQLEQVLINLVVNARDAIAGNGSIVIRTANISIPPDRELLDVERNAFSGDFVLLYVQDNGCGMDQATRERIFDPFFTTKGAGQGTGLGLATVYGVTRQQNGHIRLESAPGQGSTFYVYLPRSWRKAKSEAQAESDSYAGGNEVILLAEDDETVRLLTRDILEKIGYTVLTAVNGDDARKVYSHHQGKVDLLVTDVLMPDRGGTDLAIALRDERPDLPIIFISGYPRDLAPQNLLQTPRTEFMQKPFKPQALAGKVRQLLDAKG